MPQIHRVLENIFLETEILNFIYFILVNYKPISKINPALGG
jgi:hypothetical protein